MKKQLIRIAESFDRLLAKKGCSVPQWSVHLDSRQCVGFFPENVKTEEALGEICGSGDYDSLMSGLGEVADYMGAYENRTASLSREEVYSL